MRYLKLTLISPTDTPGSVRTHTNRTSTASSLHMVRETAIWSLISDTFRASLAIDFLIFSLIQLLLYKKAILKCVDGKCIWH